MAQQRVSTVLEVDASRAVSGFKAAENAAQQYAGGLEGVGRRTNSVFDDVPSSTGRAQSALSSLSGSIRDNRAAWDDLSSKALIGGAAIAGGLGLATKASIEWESAWAGVKKTTDGTPEQMAALEKELRGLATTLPATHEEIAGVAEAAGQLGVAREDIADFTETAIALGEATNLSAEEAATGLAKISNVMGTMDREGTAGIERMGSALVALGNDGASTEADILAMAQRLVGAGKQIGATESDILAMASALSSVGIEAELGGGAMSRALLEMNSAVIAGGEELEAFAEVAGMSAADFANAWREDPISATNAFVTGLGTIAESGGDAAATLDELGLGGTQNAQVLLRAAGASELLTEQLQLGADAYAENTALMDEANQRYATTESRLQIARNTMKDAAIDAGAVLGPALASVAEKAADVANAFVNLPKPVQEFATGLAGIASAALLVGGGAVKVIGWGQDMGDAFDRITEKSRKADGSLSRTGKTVQGMARWGGYALGVMAVATAIGQLADATREAPASIEEVTQALIGMSDAADASSVDQLFMDLSKGKDWLGGTEAEVDGLADAFQKLANPGPIEYFQDFQNELVRTESQSSQLKGVFEQIGQSLADLPADEAARKFDLMVEVIGGGEATRNKLLEFMPAYKDALTGAANEAKLAGEGASQMGGDLEGMSDSAAEAEASVDELSDAITGLGDTLLNQRGSARDYQAALDDVAASIAENGRTLDINTEAGRANEQALDALAQSTKEWAAATLEQTGSVEAAQGVLDRGREKWLAYAETLRMPKAEAEALADAIFQIPADATTEYETAGAEDAKAKADGVKDAVIGIPEWKQAQISESGASESTKRVLHMTDAIRDLEGKTVSVAEVGADASRQRVTKMDGAIFGLKGKEVEVTEFGSTAAGERVVGFKGKVYALQGKTVQVTEEGATASKGRVDSMRNSIAATSGKTVNVTARTSGETALRNLQRLINGMSGRSINVNTYYNEYRRTVDMGTYKAKAAGGIEARGVTLMAEGGMLPGGSLPPGIYGTSRQGILMAEDTRSQWEAYIPERPDLRPRAEAILAETARRFGKQVIPMADGGTWERAARSYAAPASAPVVVQAPSASLAGVELSGTLDTPWGPAQVRGIVQSELKATARAARVQGARA